MVPTEAELRAWLGANMAYVLTATALLYAASFCVRVDLGQLLLGWLRERRRRASAVTIDNARRAELASEQARVRVEQQAAAEARSLAQRQLEEERARQRRADKFKDEIRRRGEGQKLGNGFEPAT